MKPQPPDSSPKLARSERAVSPVQCLNKRRKLLASWNPYGWAWGELGGVSLGHPPKNPPIFQSHRSNSPHFETKTNPNANAPSRKRGKNNSESLCPHWQDYKIGHDDTRRHELSIIQTCYLPTALPSGTGNPRSRNNGAISASRPRKARYASAGSTAFLTENRLATMLLLRVLS